MPTQLNNEQAVLLVIDLQEKLMPHITDNEAVAKRTAVMIDAAKILGWPIIWSEQYRKGLGETIAPIRERLTGATEPLEKLSFGCLADAGQLAALNATGRQQLVLVGIETHVCVLQTALAAIHAGFEVFLAEDALGSRRASDRNTALKRMIHAGAIPATVEMLIMEALVIAKGDQFKAILPLLKD